MPWKVAKSDRCPVSKPWAVVKESDGEIEGCHLSEEDAMQQMAALYASENMVGRTMIGNRSTVDVVHIRAFDDAALEMHDGKLTGRVVPYDSPALVLDTLPDGTPDIYMEGFRKGAIDRLLRDPKGNAGRIEFKHRHDGGLGYLGPGIDIEERADGPWVTFQVVRSMRDDVADLLAAGHRGLSVEFRAVPGGTVEEDDVRWRTDVILTGVALEWRGAYSEAQVLAYRSEIEADQSQQAAAEQEARERAAADEAEAAQEREREERAAAAVAKQRELDEWIAEQDKRQAELAAKYG